MQHTPCNDAMCRAHHAHAACTMQQIPCTMQQIPCTMQHTRATRDTQRATPMRADLELVLSRDDHRDMGASRDHLPRACARYLHHRTAPHRGTRLRSAALPPPITGVLERLSRRRSVSASRGWAQMESASEYSYYCVSGGHVTGWDGRRRRPVGCDRGDWARAAAADASAAAAVL
jgi:hypothetical protein